MTSATRPVRSMRNVTRFARPSTPRAPKERAISRFESESKGNGSWQFSANSFCRSTGSTLIPMTRTPLFANSPWNRANSMDSRVQPALPARG